MIGLKDRSHTPLPILKTIGNSLSVGLLYIAFENRK